MSTEPSSTRSISAAGAASVRIKPWSFAPCPPAPIQSIWFRAVRPTFDLGTFSARGKLEGREVRLWSADHENWLGMSAVARLGEQP